jgi:hypothetical protein
MGGSEVAETGLRTGEGMCIIYVKEMRRARGGRSVLLIVRARSWTGVLPVQAQLAITLVCGACRDSAFSSELGVMLTYLMHKSIRKRFHHQYLHLRRITLGFMNM